MSNSKMFLTFILVLLTFFELVFLYPKPIIAKLKIENGTYIIDDITGTAPVSKRKKSVVREEAKRVAYSNLPEKLLDEIMPGIKSQKNYQALFEKVSSKISSLVKNFKINSEKITEDDVLNITGTCRINERALDELIGSDIISMLGNPRVMILIDEKVGGKTPSISSTESEALRIFEEVGYLIVDPDQARTLLDLDPSIAFDDPVMLSQAARTLRADIIVIGKANAGAFAKQKLHGVTLYGVSGSVQLKAILTQTAYQISSSLASSSTGRKPTGSVGGGADRCLRNATSQAARQIIYKIAYNMASAGSIIQGINVNIKISDANFSDVERIESKLKEFAGDSGKLFERSYKNNSLLEVDLISKQSARDVASFLTTQGVNIRNLTSQTIEADIVKNDKNTASVSIASVIQVKITEISSFSQASEIEEKIRESLKTLNGTFSGNYANQTLELTISLEENTNTSKIEKNIASFLEKNGIKIESFSSGLIAGKLLSTNEKSSGLLNWSWRD